MFELNVEQLNMISGGCTDEEGRPISHIRTDEEGRQYDTRKTNEEGVLICG